MYNNINFQYYLTPYSFMFQVPPSTIEFALRHHQGECFRSYWGNSEHDFELWDYDQITGEVVYKEKGQIGRIHHNLMAGFSHLGAMCPSSTGPIPNPNPTPKDPPPIPNPPPIPAPFPPYPPYPPLPPGFPYPPYDYCQLMLDQLKGYYWKC